MIATTQHTTKLTTISMAQRDTTTMTTLTDVDVDDNDTASSKAEACLEAEVVRIFVTQQPAGKNEEGGVKDGRVRRLRNKR